MSRKNNQSQDMMSEKTPFTIVSPLIITEINLIKNGHSLILEDC
jgi:hypothetical protein